MKLKHTNDGRYLFYCPGCKCAHAINGMWQFDGNMKSPTISPSILVNGDKRYFNPTAPRCHSFIKNGRIQFLSDCTHNLAGQTVELPEWEERRL